MSDEKLVAAAKETEKQIKVGLLKLGLQQKELAKVINETTTQVNRAIKGDMSPKSRFIRRKIYILFEKEGVK